MPSRSEITQAVIDSLGDTEWTLDQALRNWWLNLRETGGLRLSPIGYGVFRDLARLECYDIAATLEIMNPRNLILLDKKMTCPYSLMHDRSNRNLSLVLFGSREAMMVILYGDIMTWVNSLARQ